MEKVTPSNFFRSHFQALFTKFGESASIEKSYEVYRPKSFLEENRSRYRLSQVSLLLFQLLSAVFAFTFASSMIINLFPHFIFKDWVAGIVAAVILVMLEMAKKDFLGAFIESIIKAKAVKQGFRIKLENGLMSIILTALSVFSSIEGAKQWATNATDQTVQIQTEHKRKAEKVKQDFVEKIKPIATNIEALQAKEISRTWGLTPTESTSLQANRAEYNRLLNEQTKLLQTLDNQTNRDATQNGTNTNKVILYMLISSLTVEIFILLCIGFIGYYLGYVYVEAYANGNLPVASEFAEAKTENSQMNEVLAYLKELTTKSQTLMSLTPIPTETSDIIPTAETIHKIGFEINAEEEKKWKARGVVINYKKMQELIDKGLNNRQVSSVLKCSESAVKRYKQAQSSRAKS
jgi:hypothetical protein